jgi:hypothetical protein
MITLGYAAPQLKAYNNFDVEGMLKDLASTIMFQNISNGDVSMTLSCIDTLREQAQHAPYCYHVIGNLLQHRTY